MAGSSTRTVLIVFFAAAFLAIGSPGRAPPEARAIAIDARAEPSDQNYIGVRYKALLAEDELSETSWLLLFASSGFTSNGEYQPHFIDLMIKGGWADVFEHGDCGPWLPVGTRSYDAFTIQLGISDYEDTQPGMLHDNDIAVRTLAPGLLPVHFSNIDSTNPTWPDKVLAELNIEATGFLEGREVEVSFERAELTSLSPAEDLFRDPDAGCAHAAQDDIIYRRWIATIKVPSLGVQVAADFFINAAQGDKLRGSELLNFLWENPGRAMAETDRFRVVIFEPEAKTEAGTWVPIHRFVFDLRSPGPEYPTDGAGRVTAGFRKVTYGGGFAIEASFGYGYTDYVTDGNREQYETGVATMGVIDLSPPAAEYRLIVPGLARE